jgi:PPOX class probable F420-dependent enzyme
LIPADVLQRFAHARVAHLATVREDGSPHIVPFVFELQGDTIFAIVDDKPKRTQNVMRLANIRANSRVSVLVDSYGENWDKLWWVRADGEARVIEEGEDRDHVVNMLTEKYPQYRDQPPTGPAIVILVKQWRHWP